MKYLLSMILVFFSCSYSQAGKISFEESGGEKEVSRVFINGYPGQKYVVYIEAERGNVRIVSPTYADASALAKDLMSVNNVVVKCSRKGSKATTDLNRAYPLCSYVSTHFKDF